MSFGSGPVASPSCASSFETFTVTEAGTVVVISTLADEAIGVTTALWMHETEQAAPAEILGAAGGCRACDAECRNDRGGDDLGDALHVGLLRPPAARCRRSDRETDESAIPYAAGPGDSRARPTGGRYAADGRMFWLTRKALSGSYVALMLASRS